MTVTPPGADSASDQKHARRASAVQGLLLRDALQQVQATLSAEGIGSARTEARQIVAHVLGCTMNDLALRELTGSDRIQPADEQLIVTLSDRRARRIPLQHVLGSAPFRHLELAVGRGVFVPRPETELLVELAIAWLRRRQVQTPVQVFEAGTGSAAISLALATEVGDVQVRTVELEPAARTWAARNIAAFADAVRLNASSIDLVSGDAVDDLSRAAAAVTDRHDSAFDLVISNPPYVPEADVPHEPEARADPAAALYSGADGLDFIRSLAEPAFGALRADGRIMLEHAEQQGSVVRAVLREAGFCDARTHRDLTGRDRFTSARRPGS